MQNTPKYVVIHHTAVPGNGHQFDSVNAYHMSKGFPKSSLGYHVGYHRFIEKDGSVRTARADGDIGAHTAGSALPLYWNMNAKSIGICLAGDFRKEKPTMEQLRSLRTLLDHYIVKYALPEERVLLHREVKSTTCPGIDIVYLVDHMVERDYRSMLHTATDELHNAATITRQKRLTRLIARLQKLLGQ